MKRLIMMSLIATCCLTTVLAQKTVISQNNETGGAKDFDQRICHYGEDYRTTLTL